MCLLRRRIIKRHGRVAVPYDNKRTSIVGADGSVHPLGRTYLIYRRGG